MIATQNTSASLYSFLTCRLKFPPPHPAIKFSRIFQPPILISSTIPQLWVLIAVDPFVRCEVRCQVIHQIIVTVIQKKIRVPGKWVILGPKMMCWHNSGLTLDCIIKAYLWIALTTLDFTMKRTKGYIQIILFFQNKKIVSGKVIILGAKIILRHNSVSSLRTF